METIIKSKLSQTFIDVQMPKYEQLPNMGLYLEQTKYINQVLEPLAVLKLLMIRNYVKMGLVKKSIHKSYYAEHIAHLISISILKLVLPLENIRKNVWTAGRGFTRLMWHITIFVWNLKNFLSRFNLPIL